MKAYRYQPDKCDQIWQNIKSVWQIFEGLFSIWQNFEPTLANSAWYLEKNYAVVNGQIY